MRWLSRLEWMLGTALLAAALSAVGEPDLSSPKAAARSFYRAVETQDAAAIREVFYAATPDETELARTFADLILTTKKLGEAAKAKFGSGGEGLGVGMIGKEDIAKLDRAEVTETGDTAMLAIVGAEKPLTFHRSDGKWRLVMTDFAGGADGGLPRQIALLKKVTQAMADMAAEIEAGKYASARDAEAAIQQKLAGAMIVAARTASTGPATKPRGE